MIGANMILNSEGLIRLPYGVSPLSYIVKDSIFIDCVASNNLIQFIMNISIS